MPVSDIITIRAGTVDAFLLEIWSDSRGTEVSRDLRGTSLRPSRLSLLSMALLIRSGVLARLSLVTAFILDASESWSGLAGLRA